MPAPLAPDRLRGAVAIVTGASRGVGKGIALGLAEAGATIYVTGRTTATDAAPEGLPGSIEQTADELRALGGVAVPVRCDHADDEQVAALFMRVQAEQGRLDILVNNAFAIPEGRITGPFWELPISQWDVMHRVGLRSHYVAAVHAAHTMVPARRGLIVNVSSFGAKIYAVSVAYGVGKAGVDRMSRDMARELRPHGVAAVSLWPGIVRTERLLQQPERLAFDPTHGESPTFSGRAVAALAADPQVLARSGEALVVAELALAYDFTDLDGNRPASLRRP